MSKANLDNSQSESKRSEVSSGDKPEKKYVETPLMKQYYEMKSKHPDAILLFRVGDFYETFGDDAIRTSSILGITLTRRANGAASFVELAGFPHHALDTYMPKLVMAGERVAICEQLEDPKKTKTIVKRGIIELVTPGVSFNDNVVNNKENNYLAAVYFGAKNIGVSFLDITTGEFYVAEGGKEYVEKLLSGFAPKEVLYQRGCKEQFIEAFGSRYCLYHLERWIFSHKSASDKLISQLGVVSLKGFGIERCESAVIAAGAVLYYLEFTEHHNTGHITSLTRIDEERYVWLDKYTLRNLEIFNSSSPDGHSLVDIIDHTSTPMGGRLLRRYLSLPLNDSVGIERRLDTTEAFVSDSDRIDSAAFLLKGVGDLERLISKVAVGRVAPRELIALKNSFAAVGELKQLLSGSPLSLVSSWADRLDGLADMRKRIEDTILEEPSVNIAKGGVIAHGVSVELDSLRRMSQGGKEYLVDMQERLSRQTEIPSLKIGFNNVFGYYIEVRNTHKDKAPADWVRKQTLAGAERYITAELKEYEEKILGAEDRILSLEAELYGALVAELASATSRVQSDAMQLAHIDLYCSFSSTAREYGYNRPTLTDDAVIDICQGRHPVIERLMPIGQSYIPNDIRLNADNQVIIITGPNMAGKSALLRQCGLITLMAQIGSFVPAQKATIGVVDKIFTRVGASDNISQGESTFMVEMLESANILNNATPRSLVLLDEIGRGTSTYDGISIAWAMVEYLHELGGRGVRTLFATHYHELNELEALYPRISNFNVAVKEIDGRVIFLRKLVPGGTEHSFGIHVARLAGMPRSVVDRADEVLEALEKRRRHDDDATTPAPLEVAGFKAAEPVTRGGMQMALFQLDDPLVGQIREEISSIDTDNITPLEALNKLSDIKRLLGL